MNSFDVCAPGVLDGGSKAGSGDSVRMGRGVPVIECRIDSDGTARVTFRLPNVNRAERICLVGEFNAWCPTANPLSAAGDELVTEIVVATGRCYRFRYLLDGERWENDWAADDYVPNELGGDDSVLDLTNLALQGPLTREQHTSRRAGGRPCPVLRG
jgi:hypothetical protein